MENNKKIIANNENLLLDKPKNKTKLNKDHSKIITLFLINLKRVIVNKGIIAMACLFLIFSFIFTISISSNFNSSDLAIIIVKFIVQTFFFVIFLTLLINDLFKKQMTDGVQIIEIRSGIKLKNSFIMRFLLYILIAFVICFANMIITMILKPGVLFSTSISSKVLWSTIFFYFMFTIIWAPILIAINISLGAAGSVVLNIFIGTIMIFTQLISTFLIQTFTNNYNYQVTMSPSWTTRIKMSYDFYTTFKGDELVKGWFDDKFMTIISENVNNSYQNAKEGTDEDNYSDTNELNYVFSFDKWASLLNNSYNSNKPSASKESSLLFNLFAGRVNYAVNYVDTPLRLLENTKIFNLMNSVFEVVNKNFLSNDNRAPYDNANKKAFFENGGSNDIDLKKFINYLKTQNELKNYINLFDWILNTYNNYSESIDSAFQTLYSITLQTLQLTYLKSSDWRSYIEYDSENEKWINYNNRVGEVYNRYPELILINYMVLNNFTNSVKIDVNNGNSLSEILNANDSSSTETNLILTLNPFTHFISLFTNSFTDPITNDLYQASYNFAWIGPRKPIINTSELSDFDSKNRSGDISPIYENYTPEYKSLFSITGTYIFYLLFSIFLDYMAYLIFKKVSRV
ncbi:hypothetical protein SCORR_v1c00970 [Spiroplasma corruscae]|uniref:Uncharacterized protein n=1 Tax=Spiroplasma corruscae TaxID=216934 RepID=A0A222EMZ4_9MOLU|nr:hypothetical protein [Spiroplasma corruscae]ASP27872.1 hypothetical protein SCORR_v1c00970 [Spiroplasma corruscae]